MQTRRRALLVACDNFVTQKSTQGACEKNAETLRERLEHPGLDLESVLHSYNMVASRDDFVNAVTTAFEDSDANDLNILYISTHGLYDPIVHPEGALVFSDGKTESVLRASEIAEAFQYVEGKHLIIVDACYSGALIGKGVSGGGFGNPFQGTRSMLLTSSGGSELSWYWVDNAQSDVKLVGAGYFSAMLSQALNPQDAYPADLNHNMEITLSELYSYLYANHAASVVQVYPENSEEPLFALPPGEVDVQPQLRDIRFYNQYIDTAHPAINFSFEVQTPIVPLYQIVYYRNDRWDFEGAEFVYDFAALDEDGGLHPLEAGVYRRKIDVIPERVEEQSYAMINILSREGTHLKFISSQIIAILQEQGITEMEVMTGKAFQPLYGQELPIIVSHNIPCLLSVSIVDEQDETVYNIVENRMTRPESLRPNASSFAWNGIGADGEAAPPGRYRVRSIGVLQDQYIERYSEPFEILKIEATNGG